MTDGPTKEPVGGLRLLGVHPEPKIAAIIRSTAEQLGYEVTIVPDGERAIDRFVLGPFDVVVVEYFLPGRDGVTTVESIRWAPMGRQMRAILLAESEPELAPLAALGARIDAIDTIVGTPTAEALTRALSRARAPTGQAITSQATHAPRAPTFDDETGKLAPGEVPPPAVVPSKTMATRFDDESTVQGSAGVARAMLGSLPVPSESMIPALMQSTPDAAPKRPGAPESTGTTRTPETGPDGTRVARRDVGERTTGEWRRDAGAMAEAKKVREEESRVESGLSLSGRFETQPFPAVLSMLGDARTNGGLICKQEGDGTRALRETTNGDPPTKVVYLRGGVPTYVRSNLLDECLGQLLLRRKRIGRATLEESIRRTLAGEGLQGEILIDMGALSPVEVSETLAAQSSEKLYDLFGWRNGSWRLATNAEVPRDGMGIELALPEIVYEGVCAAMPATLLLDLLTPHLDHFVVPDAARLARFARVRLPNELRPVLAKIDGRLPLRVLLSAGSRPGAVAQMVYALHCLRAVGYEERARGRGAAPKDESDVGPPPERIPADLLPLKPQADADWEDDATAKERPKTRAAEPAGLAKEPPTSREPRARPVRSPSPPPPVYPPREPTPPPRDVPPVHRIPAEHRAAIEADARAHAAPAPAAPAAAPAPAGPAPRSPELDARVDRLFDAERHFRRGNRALERQRWDEALSAFVRAHEIVPTEGEFLAYVGWSRFCLPDDDSGSRELALTELAQAADLSPDLYVTHLLHARVLARMRRDGEARRAYERVLVLEPTNEEAKAALGR